MDKLFLIEYEYDNGVQFITDKALVLASSGDEAKGKLKKYINSRDSETVLTQFYSIKEFNGDVFTRKAGYFENPIDSYDFGYKGINK